MPQQLIPLLAFILSWFFCGKVLTRLQAKNILDNPNARSLHKQSVPRGGGLGVWLAVLPLWIVSDLQDYHLPGHLMLLLATLVLIAVSWMDDKKSLPAGQRLFIHAIAVALGLTTLPLDHYVFASFLPLWLDRLLAGFCWLWFINLTNFMDGIDGISGANGMHLCLGFLLVSAMAIPGISDDATIALCLFGALAGFLVYNWHPARLFMGDVGSIPLGFLTGYLLIVLATEGYVLTALILPLYYATDATYTLARRFLEGKKIWEAHREHSYQKAALGAQSHTSALWPIMACNAALLLLVVSALFTGPFLLFLAPLPLSLCLWYHKRLARMDSK